MQIFFDFFFLFILQTFIILVNFFFSCVSVCFTYGFLFFSFFHLSFPFLFLLGIALFFATLLFSSFFGFFLVLDWHDLHHGCVPFGTCPYLLSGPFVAVWVAKSSKNGRGDMLLCADRGSTSIHQGRPSGKTCTHDKGRKNDVFLSLSFLFDLLASSSLACFFIAFI